MLSHISTKTQTSHSSWQYVRLGTTASYDNIHREFLKHLGPRDCLWFIDFFMQNMDKKSAPWPESCKVEPSLGCTGLDVGMGQARIR